MKALTYIERGKIDTAPLITHRFKLENIEEAWEYAVLWCKQTCV